MTEEMSADVEQWLQKMKFWQDKSLHTYSEQLMHKPKLALFFQHLHMEMRRMNGLEEVLKAYPSVGQLLGRVVTFPLLMSDDALYKCVVQCILVFYSRYPKSQVEAKAKSWAVSQIRQTCGISNQESKVFEKVLEVSGLSCTDYSKAQLKKTTEFIHHDFMNCHILKEDLSCSDIEEKHDKVQSTKELLKICFHLRHIEEFSDLLHMVIKYIISKGLFELQSDLCSLCKELPLVTTDVYKFGNLTYETQILLWLECSSSLEIDLLNWVDVCISMDHFDGHSVLKNSSTHLVRSCAESKVIYGRVFSILKTLSRQSMSNKLLFIQSWLHEAICEFIAHGVNSEIEHMAVVHFFPTEVKALVQFLIIRPKDLSYQCCEHQVQQIGVQLEQGNYRYKNEIMQHLQHKFLSWQIMAVVLSLLGSRQILEYSVTLLRIFYLWPLSYNDILKNHIIALRGLLGKCTLTTTELQYVNGAIAEKSELQHILGQLWMFLLIFCGVGDTVFQEICHMALPKTSCYLEHMNNYVETLTVAKELPSWCKRNIKVVNLLNIVNHITKYDQLFTEDQKHCPAAPFHTTEIEQFQQKCKAILNEIALEYSVPVSAPICVNFFKK